MINLIEELKGEATGQLIDRGRVVDNLLDLRIAAAGQDHVVRMIDSFLADLPGKTVVETEWWISTLDSLGEADQTEPVV